MGSAFCLPTTYAILALVSMIVTVGYWRVAGVLTNKARLAQSDRAHDSISRAAIWFW